MLAESVKSAGSYARHSLIGRFNRCRLKDPERVRIPGLPRKGRVYVKSSPSSILST